MIYGKPYLITTWLSLWESCQRKLTERAFLTLSAPAGHLSQRERLDIVQVAERYAFLEYFSEKNVGEGLVPYENCGQG